MYNASSSIPKLLVALAAADLMSLLTGSLAARLRFAKIPNACLTGKPLTRSITKRTLRGVTRTFFAIALASVGAGFLGASAFFSSLAFFVAFLALGASSTGAATFSSSTTGSATFLVVFLAA